MEFLGDVYNYIFSDTYVCFLLHIKLIVKIKRKYYEKNRAHMNLYLTRKKTWIAQLVNKGSKTFNKRSSNAWFIIERLSLTRKITMTARLVNQDSKTFIKRSNNA